MLLLLIVSKKCAAQIPVDKEVIDYLFEQNAKAYYLDKDCKLKDTIIVAQKEVITYKDSIIAGQSEAMTIRNSQNEICNLELNTAKAENKTLSKKATLFKFTTVSVAIIGSISTLYFLIH